MSNTNHNVIFPELRYVTLKKYADIWSKQYDYLKSIVLYQAPSSAAYAGLLIARRKCELVIADEIIELNYTLAYIKNRFPDLEIEGYEPVEVPQLAIN